MTWNIPPLLPFSPSLIHRVWHHMAWDFPWGQLSCVPSLLSACAPPQSTSQGCEEQNKALTACKCCSAETKASLCFQQQSKTQPLTSCCEENRPYPSKNQQTCEKSICGYNRNHYVNSVLFILSMVRSSFVWCLFISLKRFKYLSLISLSNEFLQENMTQEISVAVKILIFLVLKESF